MFEGIKLIDQKPWLVTAVNAALGGLVLLGLAKVVGLL
jgi:hypothetical protein